MKGEDSYKKGLWTEEEDRMLLEYIQVHGRGRWNRIPKITGLKRCGKSCRLRWINYLSPTVKHGEFTEQEEDLIIRLHNLLGNRWALIAGRVPGRTDNQVKNHWNTRLSKRLGIKKENRKATKSPAPAASMSKLLDDVNNIVGVSGVTRRSQSPLSSGEVSEEHPPEVGRQYSVDSVWAANDAAEQSMEFIEGCFSLGEAFWQGL